MYNNVLMNILGRRDSSRNAMGPSGAPGTMFVPIRGNIGLNVPIVPSMRNEMPKVIDDLRISKPIVVPAPPKSIARGPLEHMPVVTQNPVTPGPGSYSGMPKVGGMLPPQYRIGIPERMNPTPMPVVKVPYMGLAKGTPAFNEPIRAFGKTAVVNNIVGNMPTASQYSLPQPIRMPFAAKRRLI